MKISVCIPTYNRPQQVRALLTNLLEQQRLPEEVVIVDASPDGATRQVMEVFVGRLPELVYDHAAKGLTRQRNRAIELTRGDVVVFLDDDMRLEPDFISRLRDIFIADKGCEIAGLTGVLLNEQPKTPGLGWRLKRFLRVIETEKSGRLLACGETTPLPRPEPGALVPTDYLPGCLHAWRRDVIRNYRFSIFFQGYGLGEDKFFSGWVAKSHRLFVSGDLLGNHLHIAGNRPDFFRWGYYNSFNHCLIMRECGSGRFKWLRFFSFHSIDMINDLLSWPFRSRPKRTLLYGLGRGFGLLRCLLAPPKLPADDPARGNIFTTGGSNV